MSQGRSKTSYPDAFNPDLLPRIPLSSRTVLDVGCNTGALGAAYRRVNPTCRLLGIESDPDAAAIAATRLDEVRIANLDDDPMPFDIKGGIDCIILGDILEHLCDPWSILATYRDALAPDGTLLLCVPNVEHWSFIAHLVRGDWDYQDNGLFDRTHLRWFSRRSIQDALGRAGFHIHEIRPRIFNMPAGNGFLQALAPSLRRLGVVPDEYARRALPLQYIFRSRKTPRNPLYVAAAGAKEDDRFIHLIQGLATESTVIASLSHLEGLPELPEKMPKIALVPHSEIVSERGSWILRKLISRNWVVVGDLADELWSGDSLGDKNHPGQWAVHAVQLTSAPVARELDAMLDCKTFPHSVFALPIVQNFSNEDRLRLLIDVTSGDEYLRDAAPVLNNIAEEFGARLAFEVVGDRTFFDCLRTPHKHFTQSCSDEVYLRLLEGVEFAFMPSVPPYHEKATKWSIVAASNRVVTFHRRSRETDNEGVGVLYADGMELRERLSESIRFPRKAVEIGDAARRYISAERMLGHQIADRIRWYRDLWNRREELNQALYARVGDISPYSAT